MNVTDAAAPILRQAFRMFGRATEYMQQGDSAGTEVNAFVRGIRTDDLFASAQQQDLAGVIDVAEFQTAFGSGVTPRKFDRLTTGGKSYTVQEWRGSPNDDAPVFWKILLRGGSQ